MTTHPNHHHRSDPIVKEHDIRRTSSNQSYIDDDAKSQVFSLFSVSGDHKNIPDG